MHETFGKKIEIAANISIILVALLGAITLVANFLSRGSAGPRAVSNVDVSLPAKPPQSISTTSPAVGTQISLPGVVWGSNEQSLLLVLSTRCHFCSESAPFYQRVAKMAQERGKIRLIAAFPQDTTEAKKYLQDLKLPVNRVIQVQLNTIGVRGTPTLILVDKKGMIKNTWIGRLPPAKESEVLGLLRP